MDASLAMFQILERRVLLEGRIMSTTETNLSDPGPENRGLLRANPNSNDPPLTDHGTMGVTTGGTARAVNFNANDVGYVPSMAGHCIENTGDEDVVFLEVFAAQQFQDVSLNQLSACLTRWRKRI
jgi:hypothetical protein